MALWAGSASPIFGGAVERILESRSFRPWTSRRVRLATLPNVPGFSCAGRAIARAASAANRS
jgi:hypothetical protein